MIVSALETNALRSLKIELVFAEGVMGMEGWKWKERVESSFIPLFVNMAIWRMQRNEEAGAMFVQRF